MSDRRTTSFRRIAGWRMAVWLPVLLACNETGTEPPPPPPPPPPNVTSPVPLTELAPRTYLGFEGGLYPDGAGEPPAGHAAAGLERARRIRPLNAAGRPEPGGRIVLISVGMSNTTQEFCSGPVTDCAPWSFAGRAASDAQVEHARLAIVDGALGSHTAEDWDAPSDSVYDFVRDTRLAAFGLTEAQVQVAWVKLVRPRPTTELPAPDADAFLLETDLGQVVRALRTRYPNLQQVFLSSRRYGGYATTDLHPEPFAFQSGFSVKWLIEAQIEQERTGTLDAQAGDLDLARTPWIAWGPYLWADGATPRADGLVWLPGDFEDDGVHPSTSGVAKVADLLLDFFKASPFTGCWFLAGGTC